MQTLEDSICATFQLCVIRHVVLFFKVATQQDDGRRVQQLLDSPQPTQNIHSEDRYAGSGGNAGKRLLRARFTMREAVSADHDCYKTCNFRDRSSEEGLDGIEAGIER